MATTRLSKERNRGLNSSTSLGSHFSFLYQCLLLTGQLQAKRSGAFLKISVASLLAKRGEWKRLEDESRGTKGESTGQRVVGDEVRDLWF